MQASLCKDQNCNNDRRENEYKETTSEQVKREHRRGFEQMLGASIGLKMNDDDDTFRRC